MAAKRKTRGGPGRRDGHVQINLAKIASGRIGKQLTLHHVPSNRFVVLYEHAETLWKKIEQGETSIKQLISDHVAAHRVAAEVAAYEVIAFLDELRAQGFLDYHLERERETAPLLDAQTGVADLRAEHLLRIIKGERPFDTPPAAQAIPLTAKSDTTLAELLAQPPGPIPPMPADTVREPFWVAFPNPAARLTLAHFAQRATGEDPLQPRTYRVVVLKGPSDELTCRDMLTVAQRLDLDRVPNERRGRVDIIDPARADLTVGEIEQLHEPRAKELWTITIVIDHVVIVIHVDDPPPDNGGGGSSGKSRNSCKTMCV